jgi:ABC-type transport system involved in Fe-S cluster assembly fused permease/ATPase subunit
LVPCRVLDIVAGMATGDGSVQIEGNAKEVRFDLEGTTVTGRIVEGRYPRWRDVVGQPEGQATVLEVGELLAAVRSAAIVTSEQSKGVDLTWTADTLVISGRFYDVSEGAIRLDGIDVRELAVADYRRHIGLVLQEPFLFFGTIAENIAYGRPDATRAEIVAAARAAHAHDFILRLPHGYDSLVGERGQSLSGGERQRISIARALLIDPRILILDEATSSVDSTTEKAIQSALDNLVRGRTTIAIAHRLSTLRKADRLVVLDRGAVVETGNHDELMARQGAYFALYQAQARQAEALLEDGV